MAVSTNEIKAAYPRPVYNFRVEVGPDAVAFSEVTGLSIHYEVTTFKDSPTGGGSAGPRVIHMPSQPQAVNVTMKHGVTRATSVASLYSWLKTIALNQRVLKNVIVRLCDDECKPLITSKIVK